MGFGRKRIETLIQIKLADNRKMPKSKKLTLGVLSLILLSGFTPSAKAQTPSPILPFQVLVTDNGVNEASGPLGHPLLVSVILSDPNNIGKLGSDKTVTVTLTPGDSSLATFTQTLVIQGGANATDNGVSNPIFYGSLTVTPLGSGTLTVDFLGDSDYPAQHYSRPIDVWVPQVRQYVDQKDELKGYQVHAVYVVPRDATDNGRDTRGEISTWMMQGARWLDREAGDHWQYDTSNKVPDVTFFKSSYSTMVLSNVKNDLTTMLLKEMKNKLPLGNDRKTYLFFVETSSLTIQSSDPDYSDGKLCGVSLEAMSNANIIATGDSPASPDCRGFADILDRQAAVAIHETVHTFGIEHVTTVADLMLKVSNNQPMITLDASHTQYFGGEMAGRDIQKLPIWSKDPTGKLFWPCSYNSSFETYYCKINNPDTVDAYAANCWQHPNPTLTFQQKSRNKWIQVSGSSQVIVSPKIGSGCTSKYPTSYSMRLSSDKPGISTYRFSAKGWISKSFTVVYQN